MKLATLGVAVFAAGAVSAAVVGWARAADAEHELAKLRADRREAAVRRFALEYEAAGTASGHPSLAPLDRDLVAAAIDAGWTPVETAALGSAIAEIQRMAVPVGRAISPPDGAVWQLELAASARSVRPHDEDATALAVAGRMARSMLRPGPPRPPQQILSARVDDRAVADALRELRQTARSLVRAALPRWTAGDADRLADILSFGAPPVGLTTAELDDLLGAQPPR